MGLPTLIMVGIGGIISLVHDFCHILSLNFDASRFDMASTSRDVQSELSGEATIILITRKKQRGLV